MSDDQEHQDDHDDDLHDHAPPVFTIRGESVMLAARVASKFEVETREVMQAVKRNIQFFTPRHGFELTAEEVDTLRSQNVISKAGRGGSRSLPWVFTHKGVVRLTTILRAPKAMEAIDLIIEIFMEVQKQLIQGNDKIVVTEPSRLIPDSEGERQVRDFRKKLIKALDGLLDTVIDPKTNTTVREEIADLSGRVIGFVKENLRHQGLENDKLQADTLLILERVHALRERTRAHVAQTNAATEQVLLANLDKKISIVERLMKMAAQLEPSALANVALDFSLERVADQTKKRRLAKPKSGKHEE